MRDFRQKHTVRKIIFSWPSLALLIIVLFFTARATYGVYLKAEQSGESLAQSEKELADLEARQDKLSTEITRLSTPAGVEEDIRQKYRMAKEGEHVAVILSPEPATATAETASEGGFWYEMMSFLHLK